MDPYTQLSKSLEDMTALFLDRMSSYDRDMDNLREASSSASKSPPDLTKLAGEFAQFKEFVWKSLSMLKSQIELLSLGLDQHEMASRRKVLLFHGITENGEEIPLATISKVLTDQMQLSGHCLTHIAVCHRLGMKKTKPRPVLVRFLNYDSRSTVWNSKKALKGTGITLSEFLTKPRQDAFLAARKHFGVHKCWTADGKIVLLLPDNSRRKLERMAELEVLMKKFPSADVTHSMQNTEKPKAFKGTGKTVLTRQKTNNANKK